MNIYAQMAVKIIAAQEAIIGPVAVEQAARVSSLHIDWTHHEVSIDGDEPAAINSLVTQYKDLFGKISVEVCKESAAPLARQLTAGQLPEALK